VSVGVGQLGLKDPPDAPAGDGVGQGESKHANRRGEEVTEQRTVEDVTDQQRSKGKVCKGCKKGWRDGLASDTRDRVSCTQTKSNQNNQAIRKAQGGQHEKAWPKIK